MIMKCICLVRVSSGHQDLESQTVKVKNEALKDGYNENDIIIIEDVESAVKLSEEERNGLNRMKEYINNDVSVNTVYTYEISRISRQPKTLYNIRDFLINHKVNLIVLNPYFKMLNDDGTMNETSNIFFGIFTSLAEQEGYLRKARIRKAIEKYKKLGLHTGGNIMFGYDVNTKHEYIIHKENANTVKEIYLMYVNNNMSIRHIAKEMYERGIRFWTSKGDRKPTTYLTAINNVNAILKREEYTGKGRPQIISKELFEKAQYIMRNKTICATRTKVDALLRGMIYSKESGYLLSANGSTDFYYSKRVHGPSISFECVDNIVFDWVCKKYHQYKAMNDESITNRLEKEYDIIEKKILEQYNKKMDLLASIDRLEERIVLGKISASKADELSDKLHRQVTELDSSYIKLQEERINIKSRLNDIENMDIDLDNMEFEDKVTLIKNMIDKIYIERINRTSCKLEIISKISNIDNEILLVDTYHKKLL